MRMPGYCTECRRIRQVSVSGHALATAQARGSNVVQGTCVECEEKLREPRRRRPGERSQ